MHWRSKIMCNSKNASRTWCPGVICKGLVGSSQHEDVVCTTRYWYAIPAKRLNRIWTPCYINIQQQLRFC
jgi:hypothetical protein